MKKILLIFMSIMIAFAGIQVSARGGFTVAVENTTAERGETVTLNVSLKNNTGILAMLFDLTYDRERLELVGAEDKGLVAGAVFGETYEQYPYKMLWNSASSKNFNDDGVLAVLTFKVAENAPAGKAFVELSYTTGNVYDVNLDDIVLTVENGYVEVLGTEESAPTDAPIEEPTAIPTVEPTNAPVEEATATPTEEPANEPTATPSAELTEKPQTGSTGNGGNRPALKPNEIPTEAPQEEGIPFLDVNENDWFYESVSYAYGNGIMNGVAENLFSPNDEVTRAMFVTVLYRIEGEPESETKTVFFDVAQGSYFEKAVLWASENGIVNGVSKDAFAPNQNITREQMAAMIYRYAQSKGQGFTGLWAFPLDFEDSEDVSDYAYEALAWCTMKGIMQGMDNNMLLPQGISTRAQAATVFMRTIEALNK